MSAPLRSTLAAPRRAPPIATATALAVAAGLLGLPAVAQQSPPPSPPGMMGGQGMRGGMMGGPGMGGMMGSMPRRRQAMMRGVPAPYAALVDPLPPTARTVREGRAIYAENCASCHGPAGRGDGEAGKDLTPPPANLAWLARSRFGRWNAYLYWAIAEGGEPFGTAMPAFKDSLTAEEAWALITYLQAGLPPP